MKEVFHNIIQQLELPLNNPVLIFSLILFIILLAPILLKRLNIPGIIGLILSGVIVGPYGLNLLEKNSAVQLFSTIGLLYIMFIAGLELDLNQFKVTRNKSVVFGMFTFAVPLAIGFPVCYYLLNYDLNASILTASMFATHTLVAYPIVSKLGIAKNEAVAIAVGGTILTDTAVLIILAVVMGNAEGTLNQAFWIRLGVSLTVFFLIMFLLVPIIAKWFFQKLESEKHAHYIFVLSVVFFSAFLAELAGVESIIGAFVAGLALNRLIPHSSALMNRIEFIGNSLFIPFFLISVGMLVDVRVILNGPTAIIVAGTLTFVALLGKWVAAWFTQLIFKFTGAQRQLIFGLSSSHAAATLAVIIVGYNAGLLDKNILNGTIILILVTCIVASFATEKAGKKILIAGENMDSETSNKLQLTNEHILVPVADLGNMDKLLEFALIIKDKKSANPVSILSVVPNNEQAEKNILKSRSKLEAYVKQAAATEIMVNTIATIDHNPASGIARTSREIMADIIILGWPEKADIMDKLFGEKMESIAHFTDKNLYICDFVKPLILQKRIVVISPPLAEKEHGFGSWIKKLTRMANELSVPLIHFGDPKSQSVISVEMKQMGLKAFIHFQPFMEWEDFLILSRNLMPNDIIVVISARKGSISYLPALDSIPAKLEKHFEHNNKVIIYPRQFDQSGLIDGYEDIGAGALTKSIEAIENLGKGIGNIFKKEKEE